MPVSVCKRLLFSHIRITRLSLKDARFNHV